MGATFGKYVQELNSYHLWHRDGMIVNYLEWENIRQYCEKLGINA